MKNSTNRLCKTTCARNLGQYCTDGKYVVWILMINKLSNRNKMPDLKNAW